MASDEEIEEAAKKIREEIVRQYRDGERSKCPGGAHYYEEHIAPEYIARAAYAVFERQRGWRPIETAPKNTNVLVLSKGGMVSVEYFSWEEGFQGSWRYAFGPSSGQWAGWDKTDWQPLPAPPAPAKTEGE